MRLIDADKLEDILVNHGFCFCGENEYSDGVADGFLLARDDVKEAPTIDAEPIRHGRWEDKKVAFYLKCSDCGATVRKNLYDVFLDCDIRDLNYCPHCGARMDGE